MREEAGVGEYMGRYVAVKLEQHCGLALMGPETLVTTTPLGT